MSHNCCVQRDKEDCHQRTCPTWLLLAFVYYVLIVPNFGGDPSRGWAGLLGMLYGIHWRKKNNNTMRVVLVAAGSEQAMVFANAEQLRAGERAPLTLASHRGYGVVNFFLKPSKVERFLLGPPGVGAAEDAVVVALEQNFLVNRSENYDGLVFDVDK